MTITPNLEPASQNTEQLNLVDLQNLLIIVDLASTRGAFKGPELSQIGTVFDRVAKFLQSVAPPQTEQAQTTPTVTGSGSTPVAGAPVMPTNAPSFFSTGAN